MPKRKASKGKKVGPEVKIATLPIRRNDTFASFYANNANVASAFYDLVIVFSEIIGAGGPSPYVEEKCRVVMNPAQAKALALALAVNLSSWEKKFGRISFPSGMIAPENIAATKELAEFKG